MTLLPLVLWLFIFLTMKPNNWLSFVSVIILALFIAPLLLGELVKHISNSTLDPSTMTKPHGSIRYSARGGLCSGLFAGIGFGLVFAVFYLNGIRDDFQAAWFLVILFGLLSGMIFGGLAALQLIILQGLLRRTGALPENCTQFLDYASEILLLRKVGGGYIFIHSLLRDYLASIISR